MIENFKEPSSDLKVGININVDHENWMYYILTGQKDIETRPASVASQWRKHVGETIGLVQTNSTKKGIPTGLLVGTARLAEVKEYRTKEEFEKDRQRHLYTHTRNWGGQDKRCGLVLKDVTRVRPRRLKPKGLGTVREIEYA